MSVSAYVCMCPCARAPPRPRARGRTCGHVIQIRDVRDPRGNDPAQAVVRQREPLQLHKAPVGLRDGPRQMVVDEVQVLEVVQLPDLLRR